MTWVRVCSLEDIGPEEAKRFDHGGRVYAVFRSGEGEYFVTDGYCTHEKACLADGWVEGDTVECPLHSGRFSFKTGQAKGPPVTVDLRIYAVKIERTGVFVEIMD